MDNKSALAKIRAHHGRQRAAGWSLRLVVASQLLSLAACTAPAALPDPAGVGPQPALPDPYHTLVPTAQIARAVGWQLAGTPSPAPGLAVSAFARDLDHPRWLYVLPNGDVLVAETNGPQQPGNARGYKRRIMAWVMKRAGAGVPSADRTSCCGTSTLPPAYAHGMSIGEHGSWNRKPRSGYSVVFVDFTKGRPVGLPVQVLGGFISPEGTAWGRPVGVALDRRGALLVADDVANVLWRVTASAGGDTRQP